MRPYWIADLAFVGNFNLVLGQGPIERHSSYRDLHVLGGPENGLRRGLQVALAIRTFAPLTSYHVAHPFSISRFDCLAPSIMDSTTLFDVVLSILAMHS